MLNYRRNVALDIILTILFCGLWNLWVQYEQIKTVNALLKTERFSYWKISLLSFITIGLYFFYFEFQKSQALHEIIGLKDDSDTILSIVLSLVGLHWVWDAIFQTKINSYLDQLKA